MEDEEKKLKLYQYSIRLCHDHNCDNCPYNNSFSCYMGAFQKKINHEDKTEFGLQTTEKYCGLASEVSNEEILIELMDYRINCCKQNKRCSDCEYYSLYNKKCIIQAICLQLSHEIGKAKAITP